MQLQAGSEADREGNAFYLWGGEKLTEKVMQVQDRGMRRKMDDRKSKQVHRIT